MTKITLLKKKIVVPKLFLISLSDITSRYISVEWLGSSFRFLYHI